MLAKISRGLELVACCRRLHAAKSVGFSEVPVGFSEVPVRILGADEDQIAILRLVENIC